MYSAVDSKTITVYPAQCTVYSVQHTAIVNSEVCIAYSVQGTVQQVYAIPLYIYRYRLVSP